MKLNVHGLQFSNVKSICDALNKADIAFSLAHGRKIILKDEKGHIQTISANQIISDIGTALKKFKDFEDTDREALNELYKTCEGLKNKGYGSSAWKQAGGLTRLITRIKHLISNIVRTKLPPIEELWIAPATHLQQFIKNPSSPSSLSDEEIILAAIAADARAFLHAHDALQNNLTFILKALAANGTIYDALDHTFQRNAEVLKATLSSPHYSREIVKRLVAEDGTHLINVHADLRKDKDLVLEAINNIGFVLTYADSSLKKDKDFVLAAVTQSGWALYGADDSLKKDKDVVLAAVAQTGWALKDADDSLKKDQDVVLAAVKNDPTAIRYSLIPDDQLTDEIKAELYL